MFRPGRDRSFPERTDAAASVPDWDCVDVYRASAARSVMFALAAEVY